MPQQPPQQPQDTGYRARAEAERDLAAALAKAEADLEEAKGPPPQTNDRFYNKTSNFLSDLITGTAKGAVNRVLDLGKYQMNPAGVFTDQATPMDILKERNAPTGIVQNLASYIPDIAMSVGAGAAAEGLPAAAEKWAGTSWADALKRPLAERIGGRDKIAEEILAQRLGRLTRPNASKAAEYVAGKQPLGSMREDAFKGMQDSYNAARVPSGAGITARIAAPAGQAFRAQQVYTTAPAIPYGVGAATMAADIIARLMSGK